MISKRMFLLKKNGEPYSDCFCRHPELIENYDKAERKTGINNTHISQVCLGKRKTAGRFHWRCL